MIVSDAQNATRSELSPRLLAILLVVCVYCVYHNAAGYDFVDWDDTNNLGGSLTHLNLTWHSFAHMWTTPRNSIYQPLATLYMAVVSAFAHLSGPNARITRTDILLNPHNFHIAGIMLHLVNTLLVFGLLRLISKQNLPALFGALLFGLHPLQVENVAWISGADRLVNGFLSFAALWIYLCYAYARQRGDGSIRIRVLYASAIAAGLLALFAKSTAVTLPLCALSLDLWIVKRPWKEAVKSWLPWQVLALPMILVTHASTPVVAALASAPPWQRVFVAGDALAFSLTKLVFPYPLCIDYGRTPAFVLGHWWGYATWLLPLLVALGVLFAARARSWLGAGTVIYLACLLPVCGIIPFPFQGFSTVADRYQYLALLGPALLVTFLVCGVRAKPAAWALTIAGLCVLAVLSWVQVKYWANNLALFTQAVKVSPGSVSMEGHLADALADDGQTDAAVSLDRQILAARPGDAVTHNDLGSALALSGQFGPAIEQYRIAIAINPEYAHAEQNLRMALIAQRSSTGRR